MFAASFTPQNSVGELASQVLGKKDELDATISESAPQWPVDKLNHIDLAILRLATFEILFSDTPNKVIIDEAVELAKEFGGESSPSFVNGVLGDILNKRDSTHE